MNRPVDWWKSRRTEAHERYARQRDLLLKLRTDLDAARAEFTWPRPAAFNWALEWFDVIAAGSPQSVLEVIQSDGSTDAISYDALSRRSDQVANWLDSAGVSRGDRVLIVLGQQAELWETILACLKLGAVVIPAYTSLTRAEAADRVIRGRVDCVIARSDLVPVFAEAALGTRIAIAVSSAGQATGDCAHPGWLDYRRSREAPGLFIPRAATPSADPAFAYFTSGTTSAPKLVVHTHVSYPVGHLSSLYFNGLLPGDRHVNVSAPGWAKHSWSSFFVPFTAGATLVLPRENDMTPELLPSVLVSRKVTTLCAPPSFWVRMARHLDSATPCLREATSAGEPLPGRVADAVADAWGVPVRDGYGQTETTALIGTTPGMRREPGWLGRPLPGWDITVEADGAICVDLDDAPVGLMAGYDDEERTRQAFRNGRYRTGDIGETRPDGYVRIVGRADDVFKSGGHRVSPYELEAVLRSHPCVADAAVVPAAHPVLGQAAHAVVEVAAGHAVTARELLEHVDARVSESLRVHSVEFTARLPRTASGKVRRAAVRPVP